MSRLPPLMRRGTAKSRNLTQIGLHGPLHGFRHLVEQIGRLVKPAALVARSGIDLIKGLPEPECAIADRDLGRNGEAASLQIDQKLAPALGALSDANLEADQLLPAL